MQCSVMTERKNLRLFIWSFINFLCCSLLLFGFSSSQGYNRRGLYSIFWVIIIRRHSSQFKQNKCIFYSNQFSSTNFNSLPDCCAFFCHLRGQALSYLLLTLTFPICILPINKNINQDSGLHSIPNFNFENDITIDEK